MRPPTTKLTSRMSCSDSERARDPQRAASRCRSGSCRPGRTTFCACSAAISAVRSMPEAGQLLASRTRRRSARPARRGSRSSRRPARAAARERTLLDVVAQLAMGEAVRREAVDDAEGVAELVVEARADDALRQGVPDVADVLADLVPDVRDLALPWRSPFRLTKIVVDAGARVAAQIVEVRRLLQLALEPLGDLLERVLDGGARPCRLHHHGLDDEGRVFVAAEPEDRTTTPGDAPRRSSSRRRASGCSSAHSERLKSAHGSAPEQAHLLARVQRLHAGGDDDLAGVQPAGRPTTVLVEAQHVDVAQRDGLARGIDDPDRGLLIRPRSAPIAGISMTAPASISMRPVTVAPSRIAAGGSVSPTLTSKVRVTGSACGATSRTRPVARSRSDHRSGVTVIAGSVGADAHELRRHVEHARRARPCGRARRSSARPGRPRRARRRPR